MLHFRTPTKKGNKPMMACSRGIFTLLPPANEVAGRMFSVVSVYHCLSIREGPCDNYLWCHWSVTGHVGALHPSLPTFTIHGPPSPKTQPPAVSIQGDKFKLVHLNLTMQPPPLSQTCSFKLIDHVARTVSKQVVGIRLKYLLVLIGWILLITLVK